MNSTLFFPVLPGLAWDVRKTPEFSNEVQEATSGKTTVLEYWPNPRWNFQCDFNYLRNDPKRAAGGYTELAKLVGLFLSCRGNSRAFLYRDPNDHAVRGQLIGTGDEANKNFQLVRDFGGFIEPIQNADPTALNIYVAGEKLASADWTLSAQGIAALTAAPAAGAEVTADFEFYFLCKFIESKQEFSNWIHRVYKAQTVTFRTEPV